MNAQKSRKFVVALGMAAVVAAGVVIFAIRAHNVTPTAQSAALPAPLTPVAAPPAAVAQVPEAPAAVAPTPAAPATVAHVDRAATKSATTKSAATEISPAAEPKHARTRILPKADAGTPAVENVVARAAAPAADTSLTAPTAAIATNVDPVASVADPTSTLATPATAPSPTDDQKIAASAVVAAATPAATPPAETPAATPAATPAVTAAATPAATPAVTAAPTPAATSGSDGQITQDVKSEIAGNTLTKDAKIGVSTTDGVVALTGNLASQDAIDHVKDAVGKVKDVKSVDTSALIVASL